MNQSWNYVPFAKLFDWKAKSQIKSGSGKARGKYKMFVCSDTEIKRYDEYLETEESLIFGTGGKASCHYVNEPFAYSTDCVVAQKKSDDVFTKFYYYFFRQNRLNLLQSTFTGSGLQHTSKAKIEKILMPFIPFEEQKHIVSKIEELFSELDKGVETLQMIKKQLIVYRQAVLKEAFDQIIPSSSTHLIKDVCNDIRVGIVIKPAQYYTNEFLGIKAFRSANVREFRINDDDWVYVSKEGHECNLRSEVHTGDVLIVRSGYPGTACVVTEEYNKCNAIDILIAVPNTSIVTPEYLCAFTNSPYGRKLVAEKKRGVAQAHLNVGGYSQMRIPIPNLFAQKNVVQAIEQRLSIHENISKTINAALQHAEAMRQGIFKKAFEGKL